MDSSLEMPHNIYYIKGIITYLNLIKMYRGCWNLRIGDTKEKVLGKRDDQNSNLEGKHSANIHGWGLEERNVNLGNSNILARKKKIMGLSKKEYQEGKLGKTK